MSQNNNSNTLELLGLIVAIIAAVIGFIVFKASNTLEVDWKIVVEPVIQTIVISITALVINYYLKPNLPTFVFFMLAILWPVWFDVMYAIEENKLVSYELLRGMGEYTTKLPWYTTNWGKYGITACFIVCAFASIYYWEDIKFWWKHL